MSFGLVFLVEPRRIFELKKILKIKRNYNILVAESRKNLYTIRKQYDEKEFFIKNLFGKIFKNIVLKKKIRISILPPDFYIGAADISRQLILFGQPSRATLFPTAIISHEIAHIFLSKIKTKRPLMIDEIICFLIEHQIYSLLEGKSIKEIWELHDLDLFHRHAIRASFKYLHRFNVSKNFNIINFISFLNKKSNKKILAISPPVGLLQNLYRGIC